MYKGMRSIDVGAFYPDMNRREAQLILGVREGADTKAIKDRHRKLMLINHPDNGNAGI